MIHKVKKDNAVFEIDDNVLFERQPKKFRELFNQSQIDNIADFDNCNVLILYTGRVIITEKIDENGVI